MVVVATIVVTLPLATIGAVPAGASASPPLRSRLLTVANLPAGWTVTSQPHKAATALPNCLTGAKKVGNDAGKVSVKFTAGTFPVIFEGLKIGGTGIAAWNRGVRALENCHAITFKVQGETIHGTIASLSVPRVGDRSAAYAFSFAIQGLHLQLDVVYFVVGRYLGDLGYGNIGTPGSTTLVAFADEAVDKIEGKPAHPPQTAAA